MLVFRGMPKRLILSRSAFSALRRGSSSCHDPERRLVIRFRCLVGEGTGMARSDNTFNRFAFDSKPCYWSCCVCTYLFYEVLAPICILIQHLRSSCMGWWNTRIGFVNRLRRASALFEQLLAPGTSTWALQRHVRARTKTTRIFMTTWIIFIRVSRGYTSTFYLLTIRYASIAFVSVQIALSPSFNLEVCSQPRSFHFI